MRKITRAACEALFNRDYFQRDNTLVCHTKANGCTKMYLHGNLIAQFDAEGGVYISDAGWQTVTTKERLNGVLQLSGCNMRLYQVGGVWMYGTHGNSQDFSNACCLEGWLRVV